MRKCTKCKNERSLVEYTKWSKNWCRECRNTYSRNYMKTTHRFNARRAHLRSTFGMSLDQWNELLMNQNSACKLCLTAVSELKAPLCVDHDHETKVVRGLLCRICNSALGLFKDNPETLLRAAKYLEYKLSKSSHRPRLGEDVLRPNK